MKTISKFLVIATAILGVGLTSVSLDTYANTKGKVTCVQKKKVTHKHLVKTHTARVNKAKAI